VSPVSPNAAPRIFISTGELSGEMHAAHLIRALQSLRSEQGLPPATCAGNGSAQMQAAGVQIEFDVATWSEMGIIRNIFKARFFSKIIHSTVRHIMAGSYDLVILVDNRFLNLNLAKLLRQQGYAGRIAYYVAPVRWESLYDPAELRRSLRNPRFAMIKRYCDLAIPIYPVSLDAYEQLGIPHVYPGHPLCELARPILSDEAFAELLGIDAAADPKPMLIGVLPGSRRGEISDIAPEIYRAVALMRDAFRGEPDLPEVIAVSPVAHPELREPMLAAARRGGLEELLLIDTEYRYDLMSRASVMIVKSGTGLHECMVLGVPAVMCYRFHPALAWIGRHIMRFSMPFYGFPNLLAGKAVVPELIQEECTHTRIVEVASSLLFESSERETMLAEFALLREKICLPHPLRTAAEALARLLAR
jgi:lipid-A-disaccharide synthase